MRQIFLSLRNLRASTKSEGSMMPPRRRSTKCRVDSGIQTQKANVTDCRATPFSPIDCHGDTNAPTHATPSPPDYGLGAFIPARPGRHEGPPSARTHAYGLAACRGGRAALPFWML
jgi:hypothetical protein